MNRKIVKGVWIRELLATDFAASERESGAIEKAHGDAIESGMTGYHPRDACVCAQGCPSGFQTNDQPRGCVHIPSMPCVDKEGYEAPDAPEKQKTGHVVGRSSTSRVGLTRATFFSQDHHHVEQRGRRGSRSHVAGVTAQVAVVATRGEVVVCDKDGRWEGELVETHGRWIIGSFVEL